MELLSYHSQYQPVLFEVKQEVNYKNWRDEMIKEAVADINRLRQGTKFRKETTARLAIRINMNPHLAGKENDNALFALLSECKKSANYSRLYWVTKNSNGK